MRALIFWYSLFGVFIGTTMAALGQTNVWMLTPGFSVHELPVKLSNVNNLRFTPDGRLTALGYDGRVHILRAKNGAELEDEDTLYWDRPTLNVPVGMAWSKAGLYVSSHGKVSLLRDTDGDGKADAEEIVASGWSPTDVASGGVDATGVTLDVDGNLYFGLLTADYSNPYRVRDGIARYELNGQRGTIQKWSAATKQLETIATGIRVPYTLAFNRAGDLFVTDQEGETWCPGGNPLDELNHVIPGRNYGFPPRHEKYLPQLISEPPVVAFGPQHQSSCGLVFNEADASRKSFGPADWEGDAFVAGESRGKIWRVRLAKTPAGYVGKETVIARLNMLTTDLAISPRGELYVSCHSGAPDWGTGPNGAGKIFKIAYQDTAAPQPVAVWPSGQMEVTLAFDRPISATVTKRLAEMRIEFGEYVSVADRLEVLKPPYQAVNQQEAIPRGSLRVVGAQLSPDRRNLILTTDPHPQSVHYALTVPGVGAADSKNPSAAVDIAYDLGGVAVSWFEPGDLAVARWNGWLPHLDSHVNAAFTAHSAEHERLGRLLRRQGRLWLRTQLNLPEARARIRLDASVPFSLTMGNQTIGATASLAGHYSAEISPRSARPEAITIQLQTGADKDPDLHASYATEADPTSRPLPFAALLLPWAPPHQIPPRVEPVPTEVAGGDYESGRGLYFGERLQCNRCHRLRGEGATIGPDLSNLSQRDAAAVLRDIKEPSASINPDYVAYNLRRRDGGNLTGFVRTQTADSLRMVGADGKEQIVRRADVSELRPSPVSMMPTGLLDGLTNQEIRDLLTFLLHEPAARSPAEVAALLLPNAEAPRSSKPINIILVASQQDHGPGQHDYPAWQKKWRALLGQSLGVTAREAWEWPTSEQWRQADVVVFYFWNHNWSPERYQQLDDYQARGGGLVAFHAATIADNEPERLAARLGLAAQPGPTKYLHTPFSLSFVARTNNPITRGFQQLNLIDEPYWPLVGDTNRIEVLATAVMEGQARPLIWTFQKGRGRVFATIPGHYTWTFDDPLFRILALRGIAWAAGESAGRLESLK